MKVIGTVFLLAFAAKASAEVECGRFKYHNFGDRQAYTLLDLRGSMHRLMNITNSESATVQGMNDGFCYCVEGTVRANPQDPTDSLYMELAIEKVLQGPSEAQCALTPNPSPE